jgi:hypothetical protein
MAARGQDAPPPGGALAAFSSEQQLTDFLYDIFEPVRARRALPQGECPGQPGYEAYPMQAAPAGAVVIAGQVHDEKDAPLPGANVQVVPAGLGAATDADGRFRIELDAEAVQAHPGVTLRASFVGYVERELSFTISPGDSVRAGFTLCETHVELEDVAVLNLSAPLDAGAGESITNVQHAGVDEGGIVKLHGDHLVILRRGRLFTVGIGNGALDPIDAVDAYGPGIDPTGTWYDEMLIVGDVVVVIGYSYERGGTELGLFEIDASGRLGHRSTYQLRSDDYYSAQNYSSRVVDGKLVFYTPISLWGYGDEGDLERVLPALRRWGGGEEGFVPIASATDLYLPARELDPWELALHTLTVCEIERAELDCRAKGVFGPFEHTYYMSPGAVYVWLSGWGAADQGRDPAMLYRIPLDGTRPSAIGTEGGPVDQFSFLESDDGHLNVLVSDYAGGQWMWNAEQERGDLSLLRLPLAHFGTGAYDAPGAWYRRIPAPPGGVLRNRFVGGYLLYGTSPEWSPRRRLSRIYAVDWRTGAASNAWLGHGVERIEAMGAGAVAVGARGEDLVFTSLRLDGRVAVAGRYALPEAGQGETRSHGFFYRAYDAQGGVLGLPVHRPLEHRHAYLWDVSASIVYLKNDRLELSPLGSLAAAPDRNEDDACEASCVDWYGNARPLFIHNRVFALMGYEIVEGALLDGAIRERRRSSFAPGAHAEARR